MPHVRGGIGCPDEQRPVGERTDLNERCGSVSYEDASSDTDFYSFPTAKRIHDDREPCLASIRLNSPVILGAPSEGARGLERSVSSVPIQASAGQRMTASPFPFSSTVTVLEVVSSETNTTASWKSALEPSVE